MPPAPGRHPPRRGGVALGVLGIMLMAFFSFVFMLGRHSHWHPSIHLDMDKLTHPFDLHLYQGKCATAFMCAVLALLGLSTYMMLV